MCNDEKVFVAKLGIYIYVYMFYCMPSTRRNLVRSPRQLLVQQAVVSTDKNDNTICKKQRNCGGEGFIIGVEVDDINSLIT